MNKYILLIIALVFVIGLGLFLSSSKNPQTNSTKPVVTATFYPLAEFARQVGGTSIMINTITPAGAEPHDYEPTSRQIVSIYNSELFLMNGSGVDSWADKIIKDLRAKKINVITMTENIKTNLSPQGSPDPHIWLDPIRAKEEVALIRDALIKIDSQHAKEYSQNAEAYMKKLDALNMTIIEGLKNCQKDTIIVSHDAFNYLGARYHIQTFYIAGISPEDEPSPKQLAEVAQIAKEKNISYIFFETLVNPKLADTIATEVGAKTLVLNPLEGLTEEELKNDKNYISVMQDNLSNLRIALECK